MQTTNLLDRFALPIIFGTSDIGLQLLSTIGSFGSSVRYVFSTSLLLVLLSSSYHLLIFISIKSLLSFIILLTRIFHTHLLILPFIRNITISYCFPSGSLRLLSRRFYNSYCYLSIVYKLYAFVTYTSVLISTWFNLNTPNESFTVFASIRQPSFLRYLRLPSVHLSFQPFGKSRGHC